MKTKILSLANAVGMNNPFILKKFVRLNKCKSMNDLYMALLNYKKQYCEI
ncbi:MAG: hypothetical protein LBQ05_01275 [Christensenellaceae bacterium]|jgi:hypothetical protein|nr:hypothetical protein [Christensenellaceae bacterium]